MISPLSINFLRNWCNSPSLHLPSICKSLSSPSLPMGVFAAASTFFILHSLSATGRRNMSPRNMTTKASVLRFLNRECIRAQNPKYASQMETYFKHIHPFYGIKSPALRSMIKKVQSNHRLTATSLLDTSEALLEESHGEKKMLGVYLLGHPSNLKMIGEEEHVIDTLGAFIERHVNDWATCDGLSSQVVRKLIAANPDCAPKVQSWSRSSNDWKQRASCVSFVCLARHGDYNEEIFDIATRVIQNPERFPQLGVGWVLRELSLADEPAVVAFIEEHYDCFTREGLRYAIEKMDNSLKKRLLNYKK